MFAFIGYTKILITITESALYGIMIYQYKMTMKYKKDNFVII